MLLKTLGSAILDFIYPQICVACEKQITESESAICVKCLWDLPRTDSHLTPISELNNKFIGKIKVQNVYAYLRYDKKGLVQNILHALKYKNNPELAELIGTWYGNDLKDFINHQDFDAIIPIPLHKTRLKERGYNQAFCFAFGLSEVLKIPVQASILERNSASISQTKTSNRLERFKNIESAYSIDDESGFLKDKRILLVDDVLTTGSTLEIVGRLLLNAGVKEITIITIAAVY